MLHDDLDQESVRFFTIFRHPTAAPRHDAPPRGDPIEIGKRAAQFVAHMLGIRDEEQCRVAECAGLLVYAMDGYGLTYEEVCNVACQRIAEILHHITPDNRLTDPRRFDDLRCRLGRADEIGALVKLAEIANTIECIPRAYSPTEMALHSLELKAWADRTAKLIDAMAALRKVAPMQKTLQRVKIGLAGIAEAAAQARVAEKAGCQGGANLPRSCVAAHVTMPVRERTRDKD